MAEDGTVSSGSVSAVVEVGAGSACRLLDVQAAIGTINATATSTACQVRRRLATAGSYGARPAARLTWGDLPSTLCGVFDTSPADIIIID